MNIMNVGGVHDNGVAQLQVGMNKANGFVIKYDSSLGMITITNASTGAILPIVGPSSSPFNFCGQYATYTALQNAVTAGTITPANGDTYSIISAGGTDANGTAITALCNVTYGNSKWFVTKK